MASISNPSLVSSEQSESDSQPQPPPPRQERRQPLPSLSPEFDGPDEAFPPLVRCSTEPTSLRSASIAANASSKAPPVPRADPYHLAPEDAFHTSTSPPRQSTGAGAGAGAVHNGSGSELHELRSSRQSLQPASYSGRSSASRLGRAAGGLGPGSRSRSRRRRRRTWKKLLWVKQSYPDNYTDQATFLENLQRNPRLQPYDFWPLVADSTVIVQHVCSVIIFVVCFVGIFQERLSPVAVVGWGSIATCVGWVIWELWAGSEQPPDDDIIDFRRDTHGGSDDGRRTQHQNQNQNQHQRLPRGRREPSNGGASDPSPPPPPAQQSRQAGKSSSKPGTHVLGSGGLPTMLPSAASSTTSLLNDSGHGSSSYARRRISGISCNTSSTGSLWPPNSRSASAVSLVSSASGGNGASNGAAAASNGAASNGTSNGGGQGTTARTGDAIPATPGTPRYPPPRRALSPLREGRTRHRVATIKSAVLIYFTLLGLSPILKSLTRSTSSDSIWAMSFWLLAINIFFFDYSGVWVGAHKFPVASLSTNAALMASTVLASRLPSTGQVFSLTLFSIEVFGLFPVFRRYARHRSWRYHVILTGLLVLGAGAGVAIVLSSGGQDGWPWQRAMAGIVVACLLAAVAMGGCSWWLIGLQKYKNEIYGPWDPARPIIISRRHWEDD